MKLSYEFTDLLGSVYRGGEACFSPDGNSLITPVGNRITAVDLTRNTSITFPFQANYDITLVMMHPNGKLLACFDRMGGAYLVSYSRRVQLHKFNFKDQVLAAAFSPDGNYIAVTQNSRIEVWNTPPLETTTVPFILHKRYPGFHLDVTALAWHQDGKVFAAGGEDGVMRLFSLNSIPDFRPPPLSGHRGPVKRICFLEDDTRVVSVSANGEVLVWRFEYLEGATAPCRRIAVDGVFRLESKTFCGGFGVKVQSAQIHAKGSLIACGLSNGSFVLYTTNQLERSQEDENGEIVRKTSGKVELKEVHRLSIGKNRLNTCAINLSAEWVAFGSAKRGDLLVWEWKSESYVLKQQGHSVGVNTVAYHPSGEICATGGDDGRVKLWNMATGFCYMTFSDHTSAVTKVVFSPKGNVVLSASRDGTVRAFDLVRYRNFKVLTTPRPTQFASLCIDAAGEVVFAGGLTDFDIYVWSLQTGRLLDVLTGHTGPISSLAFSHTSNLLASSSWDNSVHIWDIFTGQGHVEPLEHTCDVLSVAFRPDGNQLATTTLDGNIHFWDPAENIELGMISGRGDLMGGRKANDVQTSLSSAAGKAFTSISYSADGTAVLAAGVSKFVCMYSVDDKVLLRKYQTSFNKDLDGVMDKLNSKNMTEAGNAALLDGAETSDSEAEADERVALPGARRGDLSTRRVRKEARTHEVSFSPDGRAWAAATTDGILLYSLDNTVVFDPFDLDIDVTPEEVFSLWKKGEHTHALVVALRLNEEPVISELFRNIPGAQVPGVATALPPHYIQRLVGFLGKVIPESPHLETCMLWVRTLLRSHHSYIFSRAVGLGSVLRQLKRGISARQKDLVEVSDHNMYTLDFLAARAASAAAKDEENSVEDEKRGDELRAEAAAKAAEGAALMEADAADDENSGNLLPGWGDEDESDWDTVPADSEIILIREDSGDGDGGAAPEPKRVPEVEERKSKKTKKSKKSKRSKKSKKN